MSQHTLYKIVAVSLGLLTELAPSRGVAAELPQSGGGSPADGAAMGIAASAPSPFDGHQARARMLFEQENYYAALSEFQAAYSLRQHPILLFDMARTQQRLGNHSEAITLYRRYLTAADDSLDLHRGEAQRELARLQSLSLPPTAVTAPPATVPSLLQASSLPYRVTSRPHHHGMQAAGWSLFSLGYAGAFATGISMGILWGGSCPTYYVGPSSCSRPSSAAGWTLLIPVAGPLISGIVAPATASGTDPYGLVWTLPWLLADLPFQVVGLVLIIKGYQTPQHVVEPNFLSSFQLRPYSSQTGGGLVLSGKF